MRLKEIEARLAQIRNELNTRAAELTAEEITALETEVTDLQEERTQILEQAERRNNLLARIAAGESIDDGQGGEGAAPRVLRNFSGAAGEGDDGDKYGSNRRVRQSSTERLRKTAGAYFNSERA